MVPPQIESYGLSLRGLRKGFKRMAIFARSDMRMHNITMEVRMHSPVRSKGFGLIFGHHYLEVRGLIFGHH